MLSSRISEYDTLRIQACIFVVLGHAILQQPYNSTVNEDFIKVLNKICDIIYSFHMYLFFLISGACACFSSLNINKKMLAKRTSRLLLPYFFLGTVFVLPVSFYLADSISWKMVLSSYLKIFTFNFGKEWHLWFLPALYTTAILTALLHRLAVALRISPPLIILVLSSLIYFAPFNMPYMDFIPLMAFKQYWFWYVLGLYTLPLLIAWTPKNKLVYLWGLCGVIVFIRLIQISAAYIQEYAFVLDAYQRFIIPFSECIVCAILAKIVALFRPQRFKAYNALAAACMTIYLYHGPLGVLLVHLYRMNPELGLTSHLACTTVGLILLSMLIWHCLSPLQGWKKAALGA